MKKKLCVQCHREMENSYGNDLWSAPFCNYPECPNFELLQTGLSVTPASQDKE
jgi:hypothetical protein